MEDPLSDKASSLKEGSSIPSSRLSVSRSSILDSKSTVSAWGEALTPLVVGGASDLVGDEKEGTRLKLSGDLFGSLSMLKGCSWSLTGSLVGV